MFEHLILTLNRVLQSIFTLRVCYPLLLFRVSFGNRIVVCIGSRLTVTEEIGVDHRLVLVVGHGLHGQAGLVLVVSVGLLGAFCCTHFILEIWMERVYYLSILFLTLKRVLQSIFTLEGLLPIVDF
jgi:hypothetical protein